MQSTIQLSCHVNSHASVTHDVTSEFITSLHLVKSLHQLRFSYLNFLLEFESTFKTSFPYFFSISTRYFNVPVTSKKKTCPRTVSQIWLFDGGFKEKIAVPHRIYPGSNSSSYYHSSPEPVYSPPRRIHGRHSKGKEPYPPSPHPLPEKKKNHHDREMIEPRPLDPETCKDSHNLRHYSRHWTRLFSHDQRYEKKKLFTTKNATIRYNYWKGFKKNLKKYLNVEVSSCKPGNE